MGATARHTSTSRSPRPAPLALHTPVHHVADELEPHRWQHSFEPMIDIDIAPRV